MQAYASQLHTASVNGLAWAPHELGLALAAASSDGSVSVLTYQARGAGWGGARGACASGFFGGGGAGGGGDVPRPALRNISQRA